MSGPTPGPWIATEPNGFGTVHVRDARKPPVAIAEVLQSDSEHTAEANARLIAAAPTMREALEHTKNRIEVAGAERSYDAGLGVGEWRGFLTTWEAEAWEEIRQALASIQEPEDD